MAGYKETPRQKMIAMMYLVLTALLALNVSKEMLDAFVVVNDSVELTNENFQKKLTETYAGFEQKYQINQQKVLPFWEKAQQARRLSTEMVEYVNELKFELIALTEKIPIDSARIQPLSDIDNKDNYSTPTNFFMADSDDGSKGRGIELKTKIDEYRQAMLQLIPENERDKITLGLITDGEYTDKEGTPLNWIKYNFYNTILAADVAILNKIITEVYDAEFDIVNYLLVSVDAEDFKYDRVDARVLPKRDFVFIGDNYEAEVVVAAYSTTQDPEVYLKAGTDKFNLSDLSSARKIEGKEGIVKFNIPATSEGVKQFAGVVRVVGGQGEINDYFFNNEFIVGKPELAVSATKMNVFYVGVDNPVNISSAGIPSDKINAKISFGKLEKLPTGEWNVFVEKMPEGRYETTITVTADVDGEIRKMGEKTYRLKRVPSPIAKINNQVEGTIDRNMLSAIGGISAIMPEDFEFELNFRVVSFEMSTQRGDMVFRLKSSSNRFTEQMLTDISNLRRGQQVTFEQIRAIGPDGETRALNPINFTVN
jgi:gliding motility-associated protein GldM